MSLAARRIDFRFQLGTGAFGEEGFNVVELTGLRATANISKVGGAQQSSAELSIYGMPMDVMNKLTVLNQLALGGARLNQVTVSAGDTTKGLAVCYTGTISEAWADVEDVGAVFRVKSQAGYVDSLRPVKPISYNGMIDVATAMLGIASQMSPPRALENSGVDQMVRDIYKPGTAIAQIESLAREANINAILDDGPVLAIWPAGGSRNGVIPIISAATGMVGYPKFTQNSVFIKTLYDPSLVFGRKVEIRSMLEPANGIWVVSNLTHNLDTNTPGGQWFTTVEAGKLGNAAPIGNLPT